MTCVPSDTRFRLLDWLVGWDAEWSEHLVGLDDDGGVRLAGGPNGIDAGVLDPYIPPPRLAPGCDPCAWFLVTKPAPTSRILRLDGCTNTWQPWPGGKSPITLERGVAVAVDRHLVAVADAGSGTVWVLHMPGAQIAAEIRVRAPRDVSFDGKGGLVVAADGGTRLVRFTTNGRLIGEWPVAPPATPIVRIAHDRDGRLWLAAEARPGRFTLWSQGDTCAPEFTERDAEELAAAFDGTDAVNSNDHGFCIRRGADDMSQAVICWTWYGRLTERECVIGDDGAAFARQGQVLTHALDSGVPRCVWHRLRIDADIPPGTRVEVSVATDDVPIPAEHPDPNAAPWDSFGVGRAHPADWSTVQAGVTDALIAAPAGRYLFVRLRLSGDGSVTPRVRRIHIDFPRATSANLLPVVYGEDAGAQNFTERFLALFDASLETIDDSVARFPALLNGARARAEVLPWIAGFLSVTLDETWSTDTRRRILDAAPMLFRQRGTREGMIASIRLAFGLETDPLITEHGVERAWGALATPGTSAASDAHLGAVRLFSRSRARMTLGTSAIGRAPVRSYGSPDTDPHDLGAFRFSVALPASAKGDPGALQRLVDGQKPAHTLAAIRIAGTGGFRLGAGLALGIDTSFVRPEPKPLGDPGLRLSADAVLGGTLPPAPITGLTAMVGHGPEPFAHHRTCCPEGTT